MATIDAANYVEQDVRRHLDQPHAMRHIRVHGCKIKWTTEHQGIVVDHWVLTLVASNHRPPSIFGHGEGSHRFPSIALPALSCLGTANEVQFEQNP